MGYQIAIPFIVYVLLLFAKKLDLTHEVSIAMMLCGACLMLGAYLRSHFETKRETERLHREYCAENGWNPDE